MEQEALALVLSGETLGYHERHAAHFRELASTATTAPVKARLLREAERHEQIARGEPVLDTA